MKTNLYSIYDTASGVYAKPWQGLTDEQAMREFKDIVKLKDSAIGAHPEDYFLCRIGAFNDNTGKIENDDNETLLTGLEAVANTISQDENNFLNTDPTNGQTQPGQVND